MLAIDFVAATCSHLGRVRPGLIPHQLGERALRWPSSRARSKCAAGRRALDLRRTGLPRSRETPMGEAESTSTHRRLHSELLVHAVARTEDRPLAARSAREKGSSVMPTFRVHDEQIVAA